jgi:hypothetical protein
MYPDSTSGATYTGYGRAPTWIAKAKDCNKFLIASGAEATVAANVRVVSKAKAAVKKAASKTVGAIDGKGQRPAAGDVSRPKIGSNVVWSWSRAGVASRCERPDEVSD